jgi:cell division protein FtsI (penicillin-binding protein 3)
MLPVSASASPATPPETLTAQPEAGPKASDESTADGTVVFNVDSGVVVPSFIGKSLRSAVEVAQQSGLEINVLGSGIARQQSPVAGSHLPSGQKVTVRFSP